MSHLAKALRDRMRIDIEGYLTAIGILGLMGAPLVAVLWMI